MKERLHGMLQEAQERYRSKIRMQEEERLMRMRYFSSSRRRDVRSQQVFPEDDAPARDWRRDMRGHSGVAQGKIGPGPGVPARTDKYGTVARAARLPWMEGVFANKNAAALRNAHAARTEQPEAAAAAAARAVAPRRAEHSRWQGRLAERRAGKQQQRESMVSRWFKPGGEGKRYRPTPGGRLPDAFTSNV